MTNPQKDNGQSPSVLNDGHEEWLYSPEGILDQLGGNYDLWPDEKASLIATALVELPKEVIDFAVENIFFISGDKEGSGAQTLTIKKSNRFMIHFQPGFWDHYADDLVVAIAHEIAHAYLQHDHMGQREHANPDKIEKEADTLVSQWLAK